MAAHRHHELEQDLDRLRIRVAELEQQVNMMRMLQTAARVLLGLDPEPPGEE